MFHSRDWVPDYAELHDRYEAEQQRQLDRLPKCEYCGETITDDFLYDLNGDIMCEKCLNDNYRKPVDDYIE